jgi:hypothetical protein
MKLPIAVLICVWFLTKFKIHSILSQTLLMVIATANTIT